MEAREIIRRAFAAFTLPSRSIQEAGAAWPFLGALLALWFSWWIWRALWRALAKG